MSVPFSGTLGRSGGVISAIAKQLRYMNLKAARRITVSFDPFADNVTHTRNFVHYMSGPKIGLTNPECILKTEIVCDRSEPKINIALIPPVAESAGYKTIVLKSGNLSCLELLQLVNRHLTKLAPKEQVVATVQTKSEKKKSSKRRK